MPFRSSAAVRVAILLLALFGALPVHAADFIDDAERRVSVPDTILRVLPANQAAAVLVYVLAPDKLLGWNRPIAPAARRFLPTRYARLPILGRLFGPDPAVTARAVVRWRPDLLVYYGTVTPPHIALAEAIQHRTGVPTILLNGRIGRSFEALYRFGALLGEAARGNTLGLYAEHAIDAIRGTLLIQPPASRPLVYYGLGFDGLVTGLDRAVIMADIDQAGAINVAGSLGLVQLTRVTPGDLRFWNPDFIIAQRRSFYDALLHQRRWRGLAAVRGKRMFLEPTAPFGWISNPPSVNRLIGLYWLSSLFYKGMAQQDLSALVTEFYQTFYNVKLTNRQLAALLRAAMPPAPPAPAPTAPLPMTPTAPPARVPGLPAIGSLPALPGAAHLPAGIPNPALVPLPKP
ncbi:MAG: iron ABC transporter substrate-binding protein [Stellaceae bacterium]